MDKKYQSALNPRILDEDPFASVVGGTLAASEHVCSKLLRGWDLARDSYFKQIAFPALSALPRLPSLYLLSQILIGPAHKRLLEHWFTDIKRSLPHLPPLAFQEGNFYVVVERLSYFLSDPGPRVRSMGPSVSNWVALLKLNWSDSGWWRYQRNINWYCQ